MANSIKKVTNVNGDPMNLGQIEIAAIRGVEQGINTFEGANTHSGANTMTSTLQVQGLTHTSHYGAASGSIIADTTAALALADSNFGKTHICSLDGAAKTVTLPPNVTASDIGKQLKIVQSVSLVASGVLTVKTGAGNTLAMSSWSAGTAVDEFGPAVDANNTITITGANTNSAFGAGSTITATVVAAGEYMTEIQCIPLGAGNDAIAYSTT